MLLTIKDKEYGLKFGQLAFEPLEDELEKGGADIILQILLEQSKGIVKTYAKLVYEAIKLWCRSKERDFDMTYIDFREWFDALPNSTDEAKTIQTQFEQSFVQGRTVDEWIKHILDLASGEVQDTESEVKKAKEKKPISTRAQKSSKTAQGGESTDKPTKS